MAQPDWADLFDAANAVVDAALSRPVLSLLLALLFNPFTVDMLEGAVRLRPRWALLAAVLALGIPVLLSVLPDVFSVLSGRAGARADLLVACLALLVSWRLWHLFWTVIPSGFFS
jgi:hypothetical protein